MIYIAQATVGKGSSDSTNHETGKEKHALTLKRFARDSASTGGPCVRQYPGNVRKRVYGDDYPETISYDPKALKDLSSHDILKFKDIADSCGVDVRISGVADDALAEKLIQSGFEDYDDSFEYGYYRVHHKTTSFSKM